MSRCSREGMWVVAIPGICSVVDQADVQIGRRPRGYGRAERRRSSERGSDGVVVINQPQVPLRLPCFDFRTIGKYYS